MEFFFEVPIGGPLWLRPPLRGLTFASQTLACAATNRRFSAKTAFGG